MALADLSIGSGDVGMEDVTSRANIRAYLAEFVGTLLFVLIGTGAVASSLAVSGGALGGGEILIIAAAHGLGIGLMVYATANISGGHLNPAVTLGMIVTKQIKVAPGIMYMAAQILGAVTASAILYLILRDAVGEISNFGAHGISGATDGEGGAFLLEAILTAVLLIVIFATAVAKKGAGHMAPLAIGLTIFAIHLVAVPLTGASVNPARTLGPALVSNAFDSIWVYILAPATGGVVGALLYWFVLRETEADAAPEAATDD